MKLNQQVQEVIDELDVLNPKPIESLSPEEARQRASVPYAMRSMLRRKQGAEPEPEEVGAIEDGNIPGPAGMIPIRVYWPRGYGSKALPVLVYIHGGGWVLDDLDATDPSCRALANQAGCAVVSVEWRHAPEHPFPAAHEDVLAATQWVMMNAAEIGGNPARVAIGGESAGGTMATATCIELKRASERLPVAQALVYPLTDFVGQDYASYRDSAGAKPLNVAMLEWFAKYALTDFNQAYDVRLSPLRASRGELMGLPPTIVITAESDPLRDQGEAYAHKLMNAGVQVSLSHFPGVMHGFFGMGAVLDSARLAVRQVALVLQVGFEGA